MKIKIECLCCGKKLGFASASRTQNKNDKKSLYFSPNDEINTPEFLNITFKKDNVGSILSYCKECKNIIKDKRYSFDTIRKRLYNVSSNSSSELTHKEKTELVKRVINRIREEENRSMHYIK